MLSLECFSEGVSDDLEKGTALDSGLFSPRGAITSPIYGGPPR